MIPSFPCAETFTIPGPAGPLEVLTGCPRADSARTAVAVVCHPHPLHGGTMHNKVVHTLARTFERFGARSVRFNFRGVGASAGSFAGGRGETANATDLLTGRTSEASRDTSSSRGPRTRVPGVPPITSPVGETADATSLSRGPRLLPVGETDDLLAVVGWVREQRPNDELWLAGFSFGAAVALRAAGRVPVSRLITVAPAVHLYDDLAGYEAPDVPWLLVQGSNDEVVEPGAMRGWVESLRRRPEVVMLDGVGHFFHRRLPELQNAVAAHLARG